MRRRWRTKSTGRRCGGGCYSAGPRACPPSFKPRFPMDLMRMLSDGHPDPNLQSMEFFTSGPIHGKWGRSQMVFFSVIGVLSYVKIRRPEESESFVASNND
ncbi:hypothetical protein SDJN03_21721, partial [Cucurbita argyrosperma subsp. sororia]